jgi:hypothetical protein
VGTNYGYTVAGVFGPVEVDSCITVNMDVGTCGTNVFPAAFLGDFDPTWGDAPTTYLGDSGSSVTGPWSFPVSAGDSFVIAFTNSSTLDACEFSYSFTYERVPDAPEVTPEPPPSGCTLTLPAGSVVGDAPFETQVYYEPGNASPGLFLNPGTYPVIGQDPTETYYQIMLACQFLWVRKDSMQPSYAAPQNGAPLPTTIIGGSASGDASTAGATD